MVIPRVVLSTMVGHYHGTVLFLLLIYLHTVLVRQKGLSIPS